MNLAYLKKVSVAILSCNRSSDLRVTLDELLSRGQLWREIVVADNASSDGTVEMLRREYPMVRVLALSENEGVAGLNAALRECSGEWVLSLDDDSSPVLETWESLVACLEEGVAYDAITCSVRNSRDEVVGKENGEVLRSYLGLHQAGSLLSRRLLDELGGYDESLFLWGVELDLASRGIVKGLRFGICDSAIVEHRCVPTNRSSQRHAFYYSRNLLVYLRRFAPRRRKGELVRSYLANVITYSLFHWTTMYLRGVWASDQLCCSSDEALSEKAFEQMGADLRLPFSFLG